MSAMTSFVESKNMKKGLLSYAVPLDKELCDSIRPDLFYILNGNVGVESILDVKKFTEEQGYDPCISSVFLYGEGGSYDFTLGGQTIWIHNGTIWRIDDLYLSKMSDRYVKLMNAK